MTDRARQHQILAAARVLLEQEGPDALTMRRLAGRLGITAPSLYKHFPDKSSVVNALADAMLAETAEALEAAETAAPGSFPALAAAYRAHALAHPHLYRLTTSRAHPQHLEDRAAAPLFRALSHDEATARAAWAFAHGMVMMELNNRFPTPESVTTAWTAGITALTSSRL
ncbi:helix-turn-helix domain-containing protein [Streptomyces sp. NBC_00525]|uniref:helix-turn-helix domain-containing protein n=1 Tax=Streptomyces sp. NBC_00525 TaxID=2903660 RepID=UPI002E804122|nr:helix-turn-helix domain-containing protein [Streptomyces sp. NBC_00525]WUC93426.1 TetR/AcrR family transcriptional regulator [Streptomyces sp. NBC_00525]